MRTVPAAFLMLLAGCGSGGGDVLVGATQAPDYDRIYDASQVKRIEIEMRSEDREAMDRQLDREIHLPWRERDTAYVDATVRFEDRTWLHVGVRYKGNSSLTLPYSQGRKKLSLKLDFDEFEDSYPRTKNQRFFGVKKLNLQNGVRDPSMLRDLLTLELLRKHGAHAPRAAPLEVHVNGEFWGVYTSIEQVDKRFLKDRFGDHRGNLYKPAGPGGGNLSTFTVEQFEKKTNETEADFSDIETFLSELGDPNVSIDDILDVESFLPWLAVSAVLSNVDSHMGAPHNFYLYHDPDTDKFVFIPWDHNQSYGGALNASVDPSRGHELDLDQPWLGEKPLIQRVLAVPEHRRAFDDLVRGLLAGSLGEDRIDALQDLLAPHVARERAPYTLLLDPADFRAAADSTIAWAADGDPNSTVPGLLEFLAKRRAFLGTR